MLAVVINSPTDINHPLVSLCSVILLQACNEQIMCLHLRCHVVQICTVACTWVDETATTCRFDEQNYKENKPALAPFENWNDTKRLCIWQCDEEIVSHHIEYPLSLLIFFSQTCTRTACCFSIGGKIGLEGWIILLGNKKQKRWRKKIKHATQLRSYCRLGWGQCCVNP
jgi:ornithine carbamoyltransferase